MHLCTDAAHEGHSDAPEGTSRVTNSPCTALPGTLPHSSRWQPRPSSAPFQSLGAEPPRLCCYPPCSISKPSNPTQRLGRRRPGVACLLQDWVSSSRFSRKNFMVWGPGSGLLSCLTPEVIPKQRPTALLPLTSSRPSGEGRKGQGAAAALDSGLIHP